MYNRQYSGNISENRKKHFKKRCLQRLGRELDTEETTALLEEIRVHFEGGKSLLVVERGRNGTVVFEFVIDDKTWAVTYDKSMKILVTLWLYDEGYQTQKQRDEKTKNNIQAKQWAKEDLLGLARGSLDCFYLDQIEKIKNLDDWRAMCEKVKGVKGSWKRRTWAR